MKTFDISNHLKISPIIKIGNDFYNLQPKTEKYLMINPELVRNSEKNIKIYFEAKHQEKIKITFIGSHRSKAKKTMTFIIEDESHEIFKGINSSYAILTKTEDL